jgi:putative transposase
MGEKRSNHTVYNVNYHFVWCPKYRHAILEHIEDSLEASFRDVCDEYGYEILSSFENLIFVITRDFVSRTTPHLA